VIKNLLSLLNALSLGIWVVDKEFYRHRACTFEATFGTTTYSFTATTAATDTSPLAARECSTCR
jgi:hypothetical protein